jgi:ethanolamine-phosphate phospho-lyase
MATHSSTETIDHRKGSFLLKRVNEVSEAAVVYKKQHIGDATEIKEIGMNEKIGRELIALRDNQLGPNVSVFYKQDGGVVITEGSGCYMKDIAGKSYLDCANNVACVGHSHPTVVAAGCKELGKIQTNGRFLNPVQQRYLSKLLATMPPELNTVYMVNSGSEANDLALRIARAHSTAKNPNDVICLDYAYHGHTQSLVDISPYKWAQAIDGKNYCPPSTHVVPCPDSYRGKYRGMTEETGLNYARDVEALIQATGGVGTFIAESIVGCGGQIVLPPGYLKRVYQVVRESGGVCIADEVQTGFARSGNHFWMFQEYDVIPDIVTMGKPMGNGYPVAAVVCRREVANSFAATGIEYFNTYGGNSVACAIAEAVIDTIHAENLQQKALTTTKYLCEKLLPLQMKYKSIGDVRGIGLFQGIEFIEVREDEIQDDDQQQQEIITPNPRLTKFIVDFLKYEHVIISRDGPDENVIKIKPPLVFGPKEVDILVDAIEGGMEAAIIAGFKV